MCKRVLYIYRISVIIIIMYVRPKAPTWLNNPESLAVMEKLPNDLSRSEVYESALYLNLLAPYMDSLKTEGSIALEFGSGWGEGLIALNAFSRAYGIQKVYGSELSIPRRARACEIAEDLSLVDSTIIHDGFSMLDTYTNRASVVVASTAGPSTEVSVTRLVSGGIRALHTGGLFLIFSDKDTMRDAATVIYGTQSGQGHVIAQQGNIGSRRIPSLKPYFIIKK